MKKFKVKNYLKDILIVPLIAGAIVAIIYLIVFCSVSNSFPFYNRTVNLCAYQTQDVLKVDSFNSKGKIKKSELPEISPNAIIGSMSIDGKNVEIIYDANEYNSSERLNMSSDSILFGQSGGATLSCPTPYTDFLKGLKKGDKLTVNSFYGKYRYEVLKSSVCDTIPEVKKTDDKLNRSLIIYADNENTAGISYNYYAVVCKMVQGKTIYE